MSFQFRSTYTKSDMPSVLAAPIKVSSGNRYRRWMKRAFDVVFVTMVSLPVAVSVAILAFFVALDGRSPFYAQDRVGKNGRTFRMWKLRTMVAGADALLEAHLASDPSARAEWDKHQKLAHDPRITTVGRLLRASSLDELPQFWNVLMGEMSVVGPRPMMPQQRVMYPGTEYYALRPGITGFWQISDRNDTDFSERADYDRAYFRQMSFLTDLRVILGTVGAMCRATGR